MRVGRWRQLRRLARARFPGDRRPNDDEVNRVVMVATSWWRWDSTDGDIQRVRNLLIETLGDAPDEPAWVLEPRDIQACLAPEPSPLSPDFGSNAMAELYRQQPARAIWHRAGSAGARETVRRIAELLEQISADHGRRAVTVAWTLKRLRALDVRVFLSARRADSLFSIDARDGVEHNVCLDLTFTRATIDAEERLLCLISASVWTDVPFSSAHSPLPRDLGERPPRVDLRAAVQFFQGEVRGRIEQFLPARLGEALRRTVRSRPYLAPMFWVVTTDGVHRRNPDSGLVDRVGQFLLQTKDTRSTAVATSVVANGLRVQRRLVPVADRLDVPVYAMVPCYPELPRDLTEEETAEEYARQEDDVGAIVQAVTELEAQAAALFYDVDTDLTLWENYAHLYEVSAERASNLWDGLAMHLPVANGRFLDRVHRAIALIQQGLLQGVADLNYLSNKVDATAAMLRRRAAELADNCEQALAEDRAGHDSSLRVSLAEEGYVGFEGRRADRVAREVGRIRDNFKELFDSITSAFDERRSRVTDRFAESSVLLGLAVAAFTVVPVLDVTLDFHHDLAGLPEHFFRAGTWLLGVAALVLLVWFVRRLGRQGRLGSDQFHREFGDVRNYLRVVSTAELSRLDRRIDEILDDGLISDTAALVEVRRTVAAYLGAEVATRLTADALQGLGRGVRTTLRHRTWSVVDAELSQRLATVWELVHAHLGRERCDDPDQDVDALTANIERWFLRTMLITERPQELFRYALPQLIATYCALSALPDSILRLAISAPKVNAISEIDLEFQLRIIGFNQEDVASVYRWLSRPTRRKGTTAADVAAEVRRLRLAPGMSAHDREAALRLVNGHTLAG